MLDRLQQARSDEERAHLIQVRNDIVWFCNAMQGLTLQVRTWMHGYEISTLPSVIRLTDTSIRLWTRSEPVCYEISTLSLQKNNLIAELLPVSVYGEPGARGQVSLTIASSDNLSSMLAYVLSLDRSTSRWAIREAEASKNSSVRLDKTTFCSAISPLRQCS